MTNLLTFLYIKKILSPRKWLQDKKKNWFEQKQIVGIC